MTNLARMSACQVSHGSFYYSIIDIVININLYSIFVSSAILSFLFLVCGNKFKVKGLK